MSYKNKEDQKEFARKWYIKNRDRILLNKDRIKQRAYDREYYTKNKIHKLEYRKNLMFKQRMEIFTLLGGKCIKCGFNDSRALQIDHINGGGSKERKIFGFHGTFLMKVKNSILNDFNEYQLLCANCNWIKRFENNEV